MASNRGLMGAVANATLKHGGRCLELPHVLVDKEVVHEGAQSSCRRDDDERKHDGDGASEAFLVLPGGYGTFEELFECWRGRHSMPTTKHLHSEYEWLYDGMIVSGPLCS